jgi:hypothetical protein
MNHTHSDNLALDDRPKYKGKVVKAATNSVWERDSLLQAPMPEPVRPGAEEFKKIGSRGSSC